jgi:hypothetical protein
MHTVNTYVQNLLSKYQKALDVSCHFSGECLLSKNRKQSLIFPQTHRGWISMPFHSGSMLYIQRTIKEKLTYCERASVSGLLGLLITVRNTKALLTVTLSAHCFIHIIISVHQQHIDWLDNRIDIGQHSSNVKKEMLGSWGAP